MTYGILLYWCSLMKKCRWGGISLLDKYYIQWKNSIILCMLMFNIDCCFAIKWQMFNIQLVTSCPDWILGFVYTFKGLYDWHHNFLGVPHAKSTLKRRPIRGSLWMIDALTHGKFSCQTWRPIAPFNLSHFIWKQQ